MKEEKLIYNKVKHNHNIYRYYIGHSGVLIKEPDGKSEMVDKLKIKGESRPNLLKKLLSFGRKHVDIKHGDVVKYILKHYE